ncbi:MAG: hypothetical protein WAM92_13895 [Mycobacterium sp.]
METERPAATDGPAIERVRAELAQLGRDKSAPAVPRSVTGRVVTALRSAPLRRRRAVRVSATVGVTAALAAAGIGTVMLVRPGTPVSTPSAQRLTADPAEVTVPLSDDEIIGLIGRAPDFGPLADARRRSSCLSALGYPGPDSVLGARRVDINGAQAVVLVLVGDTPDTVAALAVRANCSSADTGLLADTRIPRPAR